MALPNRRTFSKELTDIYLTGDLRSEWTGMYGEYHNKLKLPVDRPKLPSPEYINHCALPARRPIGYPHLINMDKYKIGIRWRRLRIADGVVTVLHNWEPETLAAFLDAGVYDFRFLVKDERKHCGNFYVEKTGKRVQCGWAGYDTHQYLIENSGKWTPKTVCVQLQDRAKKSDIAHQRATEKRDDINEQVDKKLKGYANEKHSAHGRVTEKKDNVKEQVITKLMDGDVERGQLEGPTTAGHRIGSRPGFIDKDGATEIIDDGAKLANDVLGMEIWERNPYRRFETIGISLSKQRGDMDVLKRDN